MRCIQNDDFIQNLQRMEDREPQIPMHEVYHIIGADPASETDTVDVESMDESPPQASVHPPSTQKSSGATSPLIMDAAATSSEPRASTSMDDTSGGSGIAITLGNQLNGALTHRNAAFMRGGGDVVTSTQGASNQVAADVPSAVFDNCEIDILRWRSTRIQQLADILMKYGIIFSINYFMNHNLCIFFYVLLQRVGSFTLFNVATRSR